MRKVHKAGAVLLVLVILITPFTTTDTAGLSETLFITLKINGQPLYVDTNPYIKQNRTFVPIRFIAEAFHMDVEWIQEEQKAVLKDESRIIEMWIGSSRILVNNEEKIIDAGIEGKNGRTMVPIRFFAELMDFTVTWDDSTYSVLMSKEGADIPASSLLNRPYTDEDIIWLARIIHAEGLNLSLEVKVAIANVVLNRTKDPGFPDTVHGVIFDTEHSKQFPPAHKPGFTELMPDKICVIAAKMALEGINNIDRCLFFNDKPFQGKEKDLYRIIEGEHFYF